MEARSSDVSVARYETASDRPTLGSRISKFFGSKPQVCNAYVILIKKIIKLFCRGRDYVGLGTMISHLRLILFIIMLLLSRVASVTCGLDLSHVTFVMFGFCNMWLLLHEASDMWLLSHVAYVRMSHLALVMIGFCYSLWLVTCGLWYEALAMFGFCHMCILSHVASVMWGFSCLASVMCMCGSHVACHRWFLSSSFCTCDLSHVGHVFLPSHVASVTLGVACLQFFP